MNRTVALLSCVSLTVVMVAFAQSKAKTIADYVRQRERALSLPHDWKTPAGRLKTWKNFDRIPRMIWGKAPGRVLRKDPYRMDDQACFIEFIDLTDDGVADEFAIVTSDGKQTQEFGFLYDLNRDKKVDYIVYNGGTAISHDKEFFYYFYHIIDRNYDGRVDARTSSVAIQAGDSMPDPHKIIWISDENIDGKVESVEYLDLKSGKARPLEANGSMWRYVSMFGEESVDKDDESFFSSWDELLKALRNF